MQPLHAINRHPLKYEKDLMNLLRQRRLNERPDWTRSQSGLSNQQEVTSETIKVSNLGPLATEASALPRYTRGSQGH